MKVVLIKVDPHTIVSRLVPDEPEVLAPEPASDPLASILDQSIPAVVEALPALTDADLATLAFLEEGGKTRKGVMQAIADEQAARQE